MQGLIALLFPAVLMLFAVAMDRLQSQVETSIQHRDNVVLQDQMHEEVAELLADTPSDERSADSHSQVTDLRAAS